MSFEENKVLFGFNPAEWIVAIEAEDSSGTIYTRTRDGSVHKTIESFRPFLWAVESDYTGQHTLLAGTHPYSRLLDFPDWQAFNETRRQFKENGTPVYTFNDPVQHFLTQSGHTLFKGMAFEDLVRMQIHAEKDEAQNLISIALKDSRGLEEVFLVENNNLHSALEWLNAHIQKRDPDVIEGHDLFRETLPFLSQLARQSRLKLTWGRNNAPITQRASRVQIAERNVHYQKFQVYGRHFIDTSLLAQFYDITARELESYALEDIATHFHLPAEKTATPQEAMLRVPRLIDEISRLLSGSYFIQSQIFPFPYQDIVVRGNAMKIDALLLREYFRQKHSIPELPAVRSYEGGYTDIFFTGVAKPVWHCDVTSLYPSIMLRFDCFPSSDDLGIFKSLLSDLRKFRIESKNRAQSAATSPEKNHYRALQTTFKILINSFYGYLGFAQAHFADFDVASKVTETGRDLLKQMMTWLQEKGAQIIEIDTDGIYFVPPEGAVPESLQKGLAEILPPGIEVEFDTGYRAIFSYKAKNYALLKEDGELIIRGSALRSRGLEKFQRIFIHDIIRLFLEDKKEQIPDLYETFTMKILRQEWPVEFLMKTEILQDSLGVYQKKIGSSSRNRAASYELALKSGKAFQPGDAVSYYVTGAKKNVTLYENTRLAKDWDPKKRDENVEYYVSKLQDLMKKFKDML